MDWIKDLLWGSGIGHSILVISATIALGILLGKIKVFGISLGVTFILFVGILFGHFGFYVDSHLLHFFKEFGLIMFVFSIGMQVGPGFFSSFKKGGLTLNMLAVAIVFIGAAITIMIHFITDIPMATMVGVMSGAVTNTPGLGAAQQAYSDLFGEGNNAIALGYAVAYPLGVVGIILALLFVRYIFRISFEKETNQLISEAEQESNEAEAFSLVVRNPALDNHKVADISKLLDPHEFVISRIQYNDTHKIDIVNGDTTLHVGDKIFVITTVRDEEAIKAFIGEEIEMDRKQWIPTESQLISRRIVVTKSEFSGKRLRSLQLRRMHGVNITRVNRAGMDLVAHPELALQVGDKLTIVGSEIAISKVADILGNSIKRLREPNMITIFFGIALGIILGSIPIAFPGIPQPVKLGLAGGPLIIALLISRFGYKYKLITYTTISANLMLREIGISLFLACVGISAGDGFVDTIVNQGGLTWIGYGFMITIIPLLIVGSIGRIIFKINYFTLMGLISGSMTDPPALAYSNATAGNDAPAVGYATVYPLTMFLRVLTAQLLILFFYA